MKINKFKVNSFKLSPFISKFIIAVLIVSLGELGGISTANAAPDQPWKARQILVKAKAGMPEGAFESMLNQNQCKTIEKLNSVNIRVVSVPEQAEEAAVKSLSKNPHVEFAELDYAVEPSAIIPNDPKYGSAWHLPKVQAPTAWESSLADGIVIAVLDTGVDGSHPDLAGKMLPGWNAVDGSNNTTDINGHGTAVAGTAAASSNNAIGVASIAWNAQILPVRITNRSDSYAYWSDIARGLNWAADHGADVANISYSVSNSSSVSLAAQYLRSKGGLVVVAAGNDGSDPGYSDNPYMVSVSATTSSDTKASWSNYGSFIDVAAPGASILTTTRGGGYSSWSGTSFASPATAGVVALIMGANPTLTPDEVELVLEDSANKIAGEFHPYYGHGRVNAATAVELAIAMNQVPVDDEAPTVNIFSPITGSEVSGTVQVDVNAQDNMSVQEVSLYANGELIDTDITQPYQFSWDSTNLSDGQVLLTAIAIDEAGNEQVSSEVLVNVQNKPAIVDDTPPSVEIVKLLDGQMVRRTVSVNIYASDDNQVVQVMLFIDGQLISSVEGDVLNYSWNTRDLLNGFYTLEAVAVDSSDIQSSYQIQLQVYNGVTRNTSSKGKGTGKK